MVKAAIVRAARKNQAANNVDGGIYKYVHRQLSRLWHDASQEFILTALNQISVDTGMSAATLLPLAQKVNLRSAVAAAIQGKGPNFRKRQKYRGGPGFPSSGEFKSRALGERMGQAAYKFEVGTDRKPIFIMTFDIVVFQYFLHESFENSNVSKDWQSLDQAKDAMLKFIENNWMHYVDKQKFSHWLITGIID